MFRIGRVCKESMDSLYLGGDAMPWSDCVKYLDVDVKCAKSIKGDFTGPHKNQWENQKFDPL